jgi:hypothetical protein
MNDQLEADLREGFAGRAAQVPMDSALRLRAIDFRPRSSRFSTRLTVGSVTGVAAATGAIVSVVILGGAPPAFAGWTAIPSAAASPSTVASAACQAQLTNGPTSTSSAGGQSTVLDTDVRGPYTVIVYQNGQSYSTCFSGPSFTIVNAVSSGNLSGSASGSMSVRVQAGQGPGSPGAVAAGRTSVLSGTSVDGQSASIPRMTVSSLTLPSATADAYTLVDGQLGSGVTGVTLVRSDGSRVQATSGNGWFVAWWPNDVGVSSAEVDSASGQSTESFTTESPTPPPPGGPSTHSSPPPPGGPSTHSCGAGGPSDSASVQCSAAGGLTTSSTP